MGFLDIAGRLAANVGDSPRGVLRWLRFGLFS